METVLVTGGAGFIGSHTAEALLKKGHAVVIVDSLNEYYSPAAKEKNLEYVRRTAAACPEAAGTTLHVYHEDIKNREAMDKLFARHGITRVIHLAARAGVRPSLEHPELYASDNILGTISILECCRKHNVKSVVFGSSSSVYGTNNKIPFSEDDEVNSIISPYGASKKAGESYCACYAKLYHIPIACLRFFTVYGPRGRPDMMIHSFTKAILDGTPITVYGDGTSSRDYTYVADIVDGILAALDSVKGFEVINLGNSDPVMLIRVIEILEGLLGKRAIRKHAPMPKGDVPRTCADLSKAARLLGYNPKIKIEQGLDAFVKWYQGEQ